MSTRTVQMQIYMNAEGHIIAETWKNGCRQTERMLSLNHIKEVLSLQQDEVNAQEKKEEEKRIAEAKARARQTYAGIVLTHGKLFADRVMEYQAQHKARGHLTPREEADKAKTVLGIPNANVSFD